MADDEKHAINKALDYHEKRLNNLEYMAWLFGGFVIANAPSMAKLFLI
jgi:hypothetical protein